MLSSVFVFFFFFTFDPSLAQTLQCNHGRQRSEANAISQNDPSGLSSLKTTWEGGQMNRFDVT